MAILTGHSHYVMSASFHPDEDLILSASLDHSVRVWDFSALKEKCRKYQSGPAGGMNNNELLMGAEVEVKHILEGHDKGVNWAAFHPSRNLIASGADDKNIKLWRISGSKGWEMDTLRGHNNNVSCAAFHPKLEVLISNSEDKSLKIWDLNRRTCIHTVKKDVDRYWTIATHPTNNYFAVGYDRGMTIYKLERERYDFQRIGSVGFFVKNKVLNALNLGNGDLYPQANIDVAGKQVLQNQPQSLYYNYFNNSQHQIIINYDVEEGHAYLFFLNRDISNIQGINQKKIDSIKSAVFISKDKLCVLSKVKDLYIYTFDGQHKKIEWNADAIDQIYPGPIGKTLIKCGDEVILYDIATKANVGKIQIPGVRRVMWTQNFSHVALMSKNQVILCDNQLNVLSQVKETSKVKAGCWDDNNAFVYSTSSHIKFLYTSKNTRGILKSLENPVYVVYFARGVVYYINREGKFEKEDINSSEYDFKIALQKKEMSKVISILKQGNLCGRSIVEFLKQEECFDIALLFEKDLKTKFDLAISSANIEVAHQTAGEIKERDTFLKLAHESLK